jgi:hypothetical protein
MRQLLENQTLESIEYLISADGFREQEKFVQKVVDIITEVYDITDFLDHDEDAEVAKVIEDEEEMETVDDYLERTREFNASRF